MSQVTNSWQIKLLYDGDCPLCLKEVNFLREKDKNRGLILFVDIAAPDYNPADNANIDFETAMGRIHGILADGRVIQNLEVFRQIYDILGMGWVYAITKLPGVGKVADAVYGLWADNRLSLTGRGTLKSIVAERDKLLSSGQCNDRCKVE